MARKLGVALWGTGAAAEEFVEALDNHPQAEIIEIYGNRTAGRKFQEVFRNPPSNLADLTIRSIPDLSEALSSGADIHCSALSDDDSVKERVKAIEGRCASQKPTFSTAAVWRYEPDSKIYIPEVNGDEYQAVFEQAKARGWKGFIAPGPNCTSVGPAIALKAMDFDSNDIAAIYFVSLQAVSGAGKEAVEDWKNQRQTGVMVESSKGKQYDRNVYFGIGSGSKLTEVDKVRKELRHMLGWPNIPIDGITSRVPVEYGHCVAVTVRTYSHPTKKQIEDDIGAFDEECSKRLGDLYSAPKKFVRLIEDPFGPQPLLEAELYGGMCTHIGQLRELKEELGLQFVVLSHNLKKGAAKGSVFVMEDFIKNGLIKYS